MDVEVCDSAPFLPVNITLTELSRDAGLTFVPPSVVELNSLGVISESVQRPFKRVQTAPPAVFSSSHRSFLSQRIPPVRTRSQGFMIFLANNEIKTLPPEFFKLSNLTVLSLRTYLPFDLRHFAACTDTIEGRKQQP